MSTQKSIPPKGHVVICHRRWTPSNVGNDGSERRETVLATRESDEPWTTHDDPAENAWWRGVNEKAGRSWSDTTVESWEPVNLAAADFARALELELREMTNVASVRSDEAHGLAGQLEEARSRAAAHKEFTLSFLAWASQMRSIGRSLPGMDAREREALAAAQS